MEIDNLLQENGNFTLVMKNTKEYQAKQNYLFFLTVKFNKYMKLYV